MTRPGLRRAQRHATTRGRGARGVAFVWFTVLALPMFIFACALAVDFTRVVITHRAMSNVAAAAAAAGAWQLVDGQAGIDTGSRSHQAAKETMCAGMVTVKHVEPRSGLVYCGGTTYAPIDIAFTDYMATLTQSDGLSYPGGFQTIQVTAKYRIEGLLFSWMFSDQDFVDATVVRQASVCMPGVESGPTGGYCVRP